MQLTTPRARAYVYSGDWVADCPRGCGNVEHLYRRANPRDAASPRTVQVPFFGCSYCGLQDIRIEWPTDLVEITSVLQLRPIPHTRNWYPHGHDVAVRFGIPHGQSVDQLREENATHGVEVK